jgi:hypothetical protein
LQQKKSCYSIYHGYGVECEMSNNERLLMTSKLHICYPIITPISPTLIDLSDKSLDCLNPKITVCKRIAKIVVKEVFEKRFSSQLIKNPRSNSSSNIGSTHTAGIMVKKSGQFPFDSSNLDPKFLK